MYFTEYLYYRIYWILKQAIFNYDKNADSFSSVFSDFFKSKKARNTVSDEVKNLFGSVDLDGSLFDALSGKTIEDANFNNRINGLENSEKAAMSAGTALDKYKESLQQTSSIGSKAGAIFKSLAASVGTMAVMTIASKAIEVLGSGIIKTINYEKNMNKASSQMANSVKQSADNIDSYKTKIESLRETMSDSSSSIEDVTNARQELLSIQDEIIAKYGAEAERNNGI